MGLASLPRPVKVTCSSRVTRGIFSTEHFFNKLIDAPVSIRNDSTSLETDVLTSTKGKCFFNGFVVILWILTLLFFFISGAEVGAWCSEEVGGAGFGVVLQVSVPL